MLIAYVDPGLGALVWQTIVSAFIGVLFYLKKSRRWIVNFFRKIFRREPEEKVVVPEVSPVRVETDIDLKQ